MMTGNVLDTSLNWLEQGRKIALLSVTETWGSSPNPVGSLMCVRDDGEFTGSVSAGCIEGKAIVDALKTIKSGQQSIVEYSVSKVMADVAGLSCGGKVRLLIQPYHSLESFRAAIDMKMIAPPLKLMVIGAVHIAQSLYPMARQFGFDVKIIDPRQSFATPERFPDCRIVNEWPDRALSNLGLDASMAVVTLAHDPRLDDPALMAAMDANCFYIAALGSRKTHERRRTRLQAQGCSEQQLDRIHGPAGLDIGAVGADEIALSIIAQLVALKNLKEL